MGPLRRIRIGTSGWHYGHWLRSFYPEGMRSKDFLPFYADRFSTVEINNTFYRLPKPQVFEAWREQTPDGFVFACKASRFITHYSRLKLTSKSYAIFFDHVAALGDKIGPILFQLPPRWRLDLDRLAAFLAALPSGFRYAFEFREPGWFDPRSLDLLRRHRAALCIFDLKGVLSPLEVTTDLVYVRLHGPHVAYSGSYGDDALRQWADRADGWRCGGADVFIYFDNDDKGMAAEDAARLAALAAAPSSA